MNDLRLAVRHFARRPLMTATAVVTLAAGLAVSMAAMTVVDRRVLRKPALADPDSLVLVGTSEHNLIAPADFFDLRASGAFRSAAAWMPWNFNLTGAGMPERLRGALVSEDFFATLGRGVQPSRGSVTISDRLWRHAFHGDPAIIGKPITLDGDLVTVTGVTPRDFAFPTDDTDVWVPIVWGSTFQRDDRTGANLSMIGRLASGVTLARAAAIAGPRARVVLLQDEQTRPVRPTLLLIFAATMAILAI
ncbi:MAG TPA: ABC transporter permease, partial [Thermoanaerobaculia bacterium]|nr:ABC transporter permease [Thermoanaerobaculia bacterium]